MKINHIYITFLFQVLVSSSFSQGVINGYIESVFVTFRNIEWNMPTSSCDWNNSDVCEWIEGNGEFVVKGGVYDLPNKDGVASYKYATCQVISDGNGIYSQSPDYNIYSEYFTL